MWNAKVINLANGATTISPLEMIVRGIYVNVAMSAHVCEVNNGGSFVFDIPASSAAGTVIAFAGTEGVLFKDGIVINPNSLATGNITVLYKAPK